MADWSLASLQTRLIKIGARVVGHARAITLQLAEVSVSGNLFNRILAGEGVPFGECRCNALPTNAVSKRYS
jgi:hypothetical protein